MPLQGKYVVLFFYPLDFTFVCPTEITAFSDRHGDFEKLNAEVWWPSSIYLATLAQSHSTLSTAFSVTQVLGISVDSQFSHLAWCQTGK